MTKKAVFIAEIKQALTENNITLSQEAQEYWNVFSSSKEEVKPDITEKGKMILRHLIENNVSSFKSKDLSDVFGVSSRMISGSCRKLLADGYLGKVEETNPVVYTVTDKTKNIDMDKLEPCEDDDEN